MIRIIEKPSVYLIAKTELHRNQLRQFFNDNDLKTLNTDASNAEELAEISGRVCYWSFDNPRPGGNAGYIDRIKGEKHGSVIEHASYSFIFTGVSRTLTHELVRHRAGWAYSQLSQRYVAENECAFVRPIEIPADGILFTQWFDSVNFALNRYIDIVHEMKLRLESGMTPEEREAYSLPGSPVRTELRKRCRQTARSVLPGCTETKIVASANCRAIRHFLEQRGSAGAEPEIRRLANVVYDFVKADSPNIFGDIEATPYPDGTRILKAKYGKV